MVKLTFLTPVFCFLTAIGVFTAMILPVAACDMQALIFKKEHQKARTCLEQQDADPNEVNLHGASLLNQLFKFGEINVSLMHPLIYDLAQALILKGADVNHRPSKKMSPFQTVLAEGDYSDESREMLALMLRHGADPKTVTPDYASYLIDQQSPETFITPTCTGNKIP